MSVALSLNLNKIALIRNSRQGDYPSLTAHARLCIEAGADGITVHPRPDQRHVRARDVHELARHYHWTEPDILAIPPARRATYLARIREEDDA